MKRKLLVIDTETGGLDPLKDSLLSLAAVVVEDGAIVDQGYWLVKEPEVVAAEAALKVNGLTLAQIEKDGLSPVMVVQALEQLLLKHDMRSKVTIVAHNIMFDIPYMKRLYRLAGKKYEKTFSYRSLCTQTAALLLEQAGRLNLPGGSASLDNLTKHFGITLSREGGHNALNDAFACAHVLKKLMTMLK